MAAQTKAYVAPPKGGAYQNTLLAILFTTFGFVFYDRLALNYLAPYWMEELGLNHAALGLLGGIPALTWAISGILLGLISDRLDRRKPILVISIIGFTIFSAASGLVGGLASLILVRAMMGISEGAVLPISQTLMMFSSTDRRRGLNMGLLQGSSAGLLGGIVGPIVTVWMAEMWGWRSAFFFTLLPGAILAILVLLYVKELRLRPQGAENIDQAMEAPTSAIPLEERPRTMGEALRHRNIILSMLIAVFFITWFITTQTFTATYISETKGWAGSETAFALSGIGVGWVIWGALVPWTSNRFGRRGAIIIFAAIASVAPIIIMQAQTSLGFFIGLALTYTGMGCFTLFMATIPAETVDPKIMATVLGLIMGVGEIGGGFVAPWIGGVIAEAYSLDATFWMTTIAAIIVVILAIFLRETRPDFRKAAPVLGAVEV